MPFHSEDYNHTLPFRVMLSGGAAGKAGDRYEDLWTVRQLIRVVQGKTQSIRIEVPSEDKSEFVITCNDGRSEFHQAKRQAPSENWKVSQLDSKGILPYFGTKLQSGQKCVFFSTSDVKHLREPVSYTHLTLPTICSV